MREHSPRFKPSEGRKVQIKPAGAIAVGIVLVTLVGGAAMGLNALFGRSQIAPLRAGDVEAERQAAPRKVWWQPRLRAAADPLTGRDYLIAPEPVIEQVIADLRGSIAEDGPERAYEVKDFSPDGLECTLGVLQGSTLHLYRMRYDGRDQRWKAISLLYTVEHG